MFMMKRPLQPLVVALALLLILPGPSPSPCAAAPPGEPDDEAFDLENYDLNSEMDWVNLDNNIYGDSYDYDDLDQEIEVGTVAPDSPPTANQPTAEQNEEQQEEEKEEEKEVEEEVKKEEEEEEEEEEEVTLAPPPPSPVTLDFKGPSLFGPETGLGMPTCLLCVCLGGSVYCDDMGLEQIPPLPKDTTHFYGRFNKIRHVKNTEFMNLNKLKSIDLSGNQISEMDEDVFRSLPQLHQLVLADNNLQVLPELPVTMRHVDVRNNRLTSRGVHLEAFKDMSELGFLYLSNNYLDYVPSPLPLSLRVLHLQNNNIQSLHVDTFCNSHDRSFIRRSLEDIRLDGNPLNVNLFPESYVCLPRLPVGSQ